MPRPLSLPRPAELPSIVDAPGLCETCRAARARRAGYCSALCRSFDRALADHAATLHACGAESDEARRSRTRLRAVAAAYDLARLDAVGGWLAAEWAADVEAGALDPIPYRIALARAQSLGFDGTE